MGTCWWLWLDYLKYLSGQPISVKTKAILKNILNIIQGKFYSLSNNAMKRADCVMAANSNVYNYIKRNFREDVVLLNETGCYVKNIPLSENENNQVFNILWVGKFDYRKQLELAIRTVSQLEGAYPFYKIKYRWR